MYKKLTREEYSGNMSEAGNVLTNSEILSIIAKRGARVYFVGAGGVSMSSLFCLSRHFGINASGSDRKRGRLCDALIRAGADIIIGEREALPEDTSLIVYSHAVGEEQRERVYAREHGIPEVSRAKYLGALMQCYDLRIGVSGSHGKSTVTAMISKIFFDTGCLPTVLSGASLFNSELPFSIGSLDTLVYEACEYRDSFLSFSPTLAVFLNIEFDHTDYFKDLGALSESFLSAMKRADKIIVNYDDSMLLSLARRSGKRCVTYGKGVGADYRYEVISDKARNMRYKLYKREKELGEGAVPMLGEFNISNAVAAIAAATESSLGFSEAAKSLASFTGIERRLERIGEYKGRALYYDYAHHPTEISASVSAVLSESGGKVTVIFRPHTYSRTADLWDGFVASLGKADYSVILDVDAVREREIEGITARSLAASCGGIYAEGTEELSKILDSTEGAIILMGAADVDEIKKYLTSVNYCFIMR